MGIKDLTTGIQHIGIPTDNIEITLEFYKKLGFEVVLQTVNEAANERVAFLQCKNLIVETYENHAGMMMTGAIDHICLDVTDIEQIFELFKTGYQFVHKEIEFLPFWEKGVKFFTILGPNNEKIEFCQKL